MARNRFSHILIAGSAAAALALAGAGAAGAATFDATSQAFSAERETAASTLRSPQVSPPSGAFSAEPRHSGKIVPVVAGDGSLWLCNDETWECIPW